jgi:protein SCO1/2
MSQAGVKKTVLMLCAFMALLVGLFVFRLLTPAVMSPEQLRDLGVTVYEKPRRFSEDKLIDENGEPFDFSTLKGKWTLIFFGFTHCPDVCPTTMADMRSMLTQLDDEIAANTQVILVSTDPARDTPEKLKQYVHYFSPDFKALTGEFLDLQRFANQLNAAFTKVPGMGENYLIDHSANIVLLNPMGDYQGFMRPPFKPDTMRLSYTGVRKYFESMYR